MALGLRATLERLGLDFSSLRTSRIEQLSRARGHGVRIVSGTDAGIAPRRRTASCRGRWSTSLRLATRSARPW